MSNGDPHTTLRRLRRLLPPDGPRYELVDTSLAIAWVAFFAYIVFPPPPSSVRALGAPLAIVTEHQLGVILCGALMVSVALSYLPPRVVDHRRVVDALRRRHPPERQRRITMVYPVRLGYQIARTAIGFMGLNFGVSAVLTAVDMYAPASIEWLHRYPPVPGADSEATLRAALIYLMIYGYAWRRLKRDNRVRV